MRAEPNGFLVHHLNRSATLSSYSGRKTNIDAEVRMQAAVHNCAAQQARKTIVARPGQAGPRMLTLPPLQSLASLAACVSREGCATRSNSVPLFSNVSPGLFASFWCVSLARCVGCFALHAMASLAACVSLESGSTVFERFACLQVFEALCTRRCRCCFALHSLASLAAGDFAWAVCSGRVTTERRPRDYQTAAS